MEGGSFIRDFKGKVYKNALETGISLSRGPLGKLGSPMTGNFRDNWRAAEREHLSLRELLGGLLSGDLEGHGEEGSGNGHHSPVSWGIRSLGTLLVKRKLLKQGIPLYGSSFRGTWRGGSFARGTQGYERKALGISIFPHGGSVAQPGVGSSIGNLEIWLKGALGVEGLSLCGSSVKGTWREGSLARDPEGYVEKALETGISFHRGPVWGAWRRAHLQGTLRDG
jgi:hypothetical protein